MSHLMYKTKQGKEVVSRPLYLTSALLKIALEYSRKKQWSFQSLVRIALIEYLKNEGIKIDKSAIFYQ